MGKRRWITFYVWMKRYSGISPPYIRDFGKRMMEDENWPREAKT